MLEMTQNATACDHTQGAALLLCTDCLSRLLRERESAIWEQAAQVADAEVTCEDTSYCRFAVCECKLPVKIAAALRTKISP
jgi:hypothetical protein